MLASFGGTAQTVGIVIASIAAIVGLVVLVRAAAKKGTGQAEQQAAAAWESLARAHESTIDELRTVSHRQQDKIDAQAVKIEELQTKVTELAARPDYSQLLVVVDNMVAMQKQTLENEQSILATLASSVEDDAAIRAHSHEIKGSLEGIGKLVQEIAATVLTPKGAS